LKRYLVHQSVFLAAQIDERGYRERESQAETMGGRKQEDQAHVEHARLKVA
jgi:hypothetical protein